MPDRTPELGRSIEVPQNSILSPTGRDSGRWSFENVLTKSAIALGAVAIFGGSFALMSKVIPNEVNDLARFGPSLVVSYYSGLFVAELLKARFKIA